MNIIIIHNFPVYLHSYLYPKHHLFRAFTGFSLNTNVTTPATHNLPSFGNNILVNYFIYLSVFPYLLETKFQEWDHTSIHAPSCSLFLFPCPTLPLFWIHSLLTSLTVHSHWDLPGLGATASPIWHLSHTTPSIYAQAICHYMLKLLSDLNEDMNCYCYFCSVFSNVCMEVCML